MFRERPLTWLFVAATIAVDLVMVSLGTMSAKAPLIIFSISGLILGQSAILGIWFSAGQLHRLARGAVFVGGQCCLALCCSRLFGIDWGRPISLYFSFGICVFLAHCLWRYFFTSHLSMEQQSKKPLQFPLIELFGWTIVVAFASLALRSADFSGFLREPVYLYFYFLISPAVSGLLAVIFLPGRALSVRSFLLATIVLIGYFTLSYLFVEEDRVFIILTAFGMLHFYVLCWLFVQRLDHLTCQMAKVRESSTMSPEPKRDAARSVDN